MIRLTLTSLAGVCVLLAGCGGTPARVQQPSYNSGAGADAIGAYDTNSDGSISGQELESVPALREAKAQVDSNSDGSLSADEINARVDAWRESRIGQMAAICEVKLNGAPLANAEIVFEPEPFTGSNLPTGTGTTDEDGVAGVASGGGSFGMPCGFYKIRITSPDVQIPAKYNTETTLGCEVANYSHWQNAGAVKLNLSSE